MTIVGKKYTPLEFNDYCKGIKKQHWVQHIILHNTASPSLAQRPGGVLTETHIKNLKTYYEGLGWSAGPHLFVDATGIWVFTPLDKHGVHSPSFNIDSWGVEMLGDYNTESFTEGLGDKVRQNALSAVRSLMQIQGWKSVDGILKLHKEDPQTTHDCPGKNVSKAQFIKALSPAPSLIVKGTPTTSIRVGSITYAPVRELAEKLGHTVTFDVQTNTVTVK